MTSPAVSDAGGCGDAGCEQRCASGDCVMKPDGPSVDDAHGRPDAGSAAGSGVDAGSATADAGAASDTSTGGFDDSDAGGCEPGFAGEDGGACAKPDVQECDAVPSPCPANAECVADDGGHHCLCREGFDEGPPGTCLDVDECADEPPCDERAFCRNAVGSFACVCPAYYTTHDDGRTCEDARYRWHAALTASNLQVIPNQDGDLFLVATFEGGTGFAGSNYASAGLSDLLVAKLDAERELSWVRQLGAAGEDTSISAALDPGGDLVIVGHTSGGFDMGAGLLETGGARSRYVAKFQKSNGACLWSVLMPNTAVEAPEVDWWQTVDVDPDGNVLVSGKLYGTLDAGETHLVSGGGADVYVVKLSATGEVLWAKSWGSAGDDSSHGVAADPQGNLFVLASFDQTLSFGGDLFVSRGSYDAALVKLNAQGEHVWSKQYGGVSYDLPGRLAADDAGNAVMAGHFWAVTTIGASELTTRGQWDAYLAKVGSDGDVAWVVQVGGAGTEHAWGVAADAAGNALVSGIGDDLLDFGEGARSVAGSQDAFVLKVASDGSHVWSQRFGGQGWDTSSFLATGPDLRVYTAGVMAPPVDFGGGPEIGGTEYALELAP